MTRCFKCGETLIGVCPNALNETKEKIQAIEALLVEHEICIKSGRCFGIPYHEAQGNLHKFIYDLLRLLHSSVTKEIR